MQVPNIKPRREDISNECQPDKGEGTEKEEKHSDLTSHINM